MSCGHGRALGWTLGPLGRSGSAGASGGLAYADSLTSFALSRILVMSSIVLSASLPCMVIILSGLLPVYPLRPL